MSNDFIRWIWIPSLAAVLAIAAAQIRAADEPNAPPDHSRMHHGMTSSMVFARVKIR